MHERCQNPGFLVGCADALMPYLSVHARRKRALVAEALPELFDCDGQLRRP